jgi:hypothetical protein
MDWSEIGALGNLLGALGVVVSLIYLGVQIKHQIREARVTAVHELTENFRGFLMALAENEQLGDIWVRGIYDFPGLAPVERLRLSSALGNAFRIFDTLYNYYNEGIIDAQSWATLEAPVNDLLAYPGIQAWWPTRKHWYSQPYQLRIDDKIAHSRSPSMYGEQTPR